MYLFDTFSNFLSGLGIIGRDKMTASSYVSRVWTRDQLEASFRSDWIARKAITIPAMDATREWRSWQAEADQIELLEATEDRLQLQLKLQIALTKANLYGGCCMLIGTDGNLASELKPESIKKDGLKFIHVLSPHEVVVKDLIRDISSPYYGQPEFYELNDETKKFGNVQIHPSRMVRLNGLDTPDPLANFGWGDPMLQMIHDAVNAAGMVTQSVAVMISEAKLDVIKVPGLTEILATSDGTNRMIKRFSEANVAKSVVNGIIIDGEEEWQRIGVDFSGMPEILQMYLMIAAGAADIPATRFLGRSPAGLNATGDSDLINYYDRIASNQMLRLSPALEKLDVAVQMSSLGKFDENIFYEWRPLWQMSESEKADIHAKKAATAKVDVDSGLIPFEALSIGRANQLIEDGVYPGLEAALEEALAAQELLTEPESFDEELDEDGEVVEERKALPKPGVGGRNSNEDEEDFEDKAWDESMVIRDPGGEGGGQFISGGGGSEHSKGAGLSKRGRALTSNAIIEETGSVKPNSVRVHDLAKRLNARAAPELQKELGQSSVDVKHTSEKADDFIAGVIAQELRDGLHNGRSGEQWYDETMREAMETAALIYPGVDTDPDKKFLYTSALAITSQGEVVDSSVRLADEAYNYFQENGRFPTDMEVADPNININFKKVNGLIKNGGIASTRDLFNSEMTVRDLQKLTGKKVGGIGMDEKVYGSAILGAKIGQGFYQNLNGNFKPITMDLWFMRSWGRITNSGIAKTNWDKVSGRFEKALAAGGMPVPETKKGKDKLATQIYAQHERDYQKHQAEFKSGERKKSELVKSSERYVHHLLGNMVEMPKGVNHRRWITKVFHQALDKLKAQNIHLTPAGAQATWWWPEKTLYGQMGVQVKELDTDYAKSLKKLAQSRGKA